MSDKNKNPGEEIEILVRDTDLTISVDEQLEALRKKVGELERSRDAWIDTANYLNDMTIDLQTDVDNLQAVVEAAKDFAYRSGAVMAERTPYLGVLKDALEALEVSDG